MTDFGVYGRLDQLQQRVTKLERALDAVVAATGVALPSEPATDEASINNPVDEEIATLLRAGHSVRWAG